MIPSNQGAPNHRTAKATSRPPFESYLSKPTKERISRVSACKKHQIHGFMVYFFISYGFRSGRHKSFVLLSFIPSLSKVLYKYINTLDACHMISGSSSGIASFLKGSSLSCRTPSTPVVLTFYRVNVWESIFGTSLEFLLDGGLATQPLHNGGPLRVVALRS